MNMNLHTTYKQTILWIKKKLSFYFCNMIDSTDQL